MEIMEIMEIKEITEIMEIMEIMQITDDMNDNVDFVRVSLAFEILYDICSLFYVLSPQRGPFGDDDDDVDDDEEHHDMLLIASTEYTLFSYFAAQISRYICCFCF